MALGVSAMSAVDANRWPGRGPLITISHRMVGPHRKSILSRVPARVVAPSMLVLPLIIASAALIGIAMTRGREAVRRLATENFAIMHDRISRRLGDMLAMPGRANRLNIDLLNEGRLSPDDLRTWQRILYEQAQIFDTLSCISWDGADGRQAWVARYPGGHDYFFGINNDKSVRQVLEFRYLGDGSLASTPRGSYPIDPRDFPPFRTGAASTQPAWSPPFEWVNEDGAVLTFALAYAQGYRDSTGRLLGVVTAQFTLHDISRYLAQLPLGTAGQAFIADEAGYLVADSGLHDIMDARRQRLAASAAADPAIVAATRHLAQVGAAIGSDDAPYRSSFDLNGQTYLMMASRFEHPTGLRWRIVTLCPQSQFTAEVDATGQQSLLIALGVVGATVIGGVVLAMLALRPLMTLVEHLRRIGGGDLTTPLELSQTPELVRLSSEINRMTANLQEHMRLRNSLAIADQVQRTLLPSKLPTAAGIDVAAYSHYSDQTGGDYYDFLDLRDQRQGILTVVVGDVMGHGIPSAMLMASARGILKSHSSVTSSLGELLTYMNRHLVGDGNFRTARFMTMLLLTLDPEAGHMHWASAGHDMPIIYDPSDGRFLEIDGGGLPLAILEDQVYLDFTFSGLRPGQVILAGTDGLWDMISPDGERFGKQRICDLVQRCAAMPAAGIISTLEQELAAFRGTARIEDDVTVVVLKVSPQPAAVDVTR